MFSKNKLKIDIWNFTMFYFLSKWLHKQSYNSGVVFLVSTAAQLGNKKETILCSRRSKKNAIKTKLKF